MKDYIKKVFQDLIVNRDINRSVGKAREYAQETSVERVFRRDQRHPRTWCHHAHLAGGTPRRCNCIINRSRCSADYDCLIVAILDVLQRLCLMTYL